MSDNKHAHHVEGMTDHSAKAFHAKKKVFELERKLAGIREEAKLHEDLAEQHRLLIEKGKRARVLAGKDVKVDPLRNEKKRYVVVSTEIKETLELLTDLHLSASTLATANIAFEGSYKSLISSPIGVHTKGLLATVFTVVLSAVAEAKGRIDSFLRGKTSKSAKAKAKADADKKHDEARMKNLRATFSALCDELDTVRDDYDRFSLGSGTVSACKSDMEEKFNEFIETNLLDSAQFTLSQARGKLGSFYATINSHKAKIASEKNKLQAQASKLGVRVASAQTVWNTPVAVPYYAPIPQRINGVQGDWYPVVRVHGSGASGVSNFGALMTRQIHGTVRGMYQ